MARLDLLASAMGDGGGIGGAGKKIDGDGLEQRGGDGLDVLKMKDNVRDEVEGEL
jgi:hypothetical protein